MRRALIVVILNVVFVMANLWPASAAQQMRLVDLVSTESVLRWINSYRFHPDPADVPDVVKALGRMGAFKDAESSGAYIGFIAGVIGSSGSDAEGLIERMFPLPEENHWVVVRAIAYSGHPDWKHLLRVVAEQTPTRGVMINKYLTGQTPTLFQVAARRTPPLSQRVGHYFSYNTYFGAAKKQAREELEVSPELLDTFWGYYFATGRYRPVARIIAMLQMTTDANSVENLMLGNMAKYTLASNSVRDARLLALLKQSLPQQPKPVANVLKDVVDAAETVDTARIRREAMASIEELRRKGPASRRDASRWGQIGLGALSIGCVAAAATGQVEFGLPCVLGGAISSAGLQYWERQQ